MEKKVLILLISIPLYVAVVGCAIFPKPVAVLICTVSTTGGTPVGSAEVAATPMFAQRKAMLGRAITDSDGICTMRLVPSTYSIRVEHEDYEPLELGEPRPLTKGDNELYLVLQSKKPHLVAVSGSVNAADGTPIAGAKIVAKPIDDEVDALETETHTNSRGQYSMELIPYVYNVSASHDKYQGVELKDEILTSDTDGLDFELQALATIIAKVYDEVSGASIANALVTVAPKEKAGKPAIEQRQEEESFIFVVWPGIYDVTATYEKTSGEAIEQKADTEEVEVKGGEIVEVELKLSKLPEPGPKPTGMKEPIHEGPVDHERGR